MLFRCHVKKKLLTRRDGLLRFCSMLAGSCARTAQRSSSCQKKRSSPSSCSLPGSMAWRRDAGRQDCVLLTQPPKKKKEKRERCSFCQICPFSLSCIHRMALSVCRGGSARPKQSRGCGSLQPRELFPFSLESGLVRPPAGAGLASHFSKMQIQHCICNSVRPHDSPFRRAVRRHCDGSGRQNGHLLGTARL